MSWPLSSELQARASVAARQARARAYAPYSNFRVGAALVTTSGAIFSGCNVENASYGLCLCAERAAVAAAVAAGERDFLAVVIVTGSSPPSPPCGMCRQTLSEFNPDLAVLLENDQGEERRMELSALYPASFDATLLREGQDPAGGDT